MQFVATGYYKRIKFMAFPALAILLNMLRCLSEDSSFIAPLCWKVQVVMHFPLLNLYPQSAAVPSCSPEVSLSEHPMLQLTPCPSSLPYRAEWDDIRVLGILGRWRGWASKKSQTNLIITLQLLYA
jgi:hypothetical protein